MSINFDGFDEQEIPAEEKLRQVRLQFERSEFERIKSEVSSLPVEKQQVIYKHLSQILDPIH